MKLAMPLLEAHPHWIKVIEVKDIYPVPFLPRYRKGGKNALIFTHLDYLNQDRDVPVGKYDLYHFLKGIDPHKHGGCPGGR